MFGHAIHGLHQRSGRGRRGAVHQQKAIVVRVNDDVGFAGKLDDEEIVREPLDARVVRCLRGRRSQVADRRDDEAGGAGTAYLETVAPSLTALFSHGLQTFSVGQNRAQRSPLGGRMKRPAKAGRYVHLRVSS